LLNKGDGTFERQYTLPVGLDPLAVAVADLEHNGAEDIVTANLSDQTLSVLLGDGKGSFPNQRTYTLGGYPAALAVADVNGDGKPDLIVAEDNVNPNSNGVVDVLVGDGSGSFKLQSTTPVGPNPSSLAVADVNGDGTPDLVVTDSNDNTVRVLLGDGHGAFQPLQPYTVGDSLKSVAARDVNGDGKPDLIVASAGDNTVRVLLGQGDGTFTPSTPSKGVGARNTPYLAALTGDSTPDSVILDRSGNILFRQGVPGTDQPFGSPLTLNDTVVYSPMETEAIAAAGNLAVPSGFHINTATGELEGELTAHDLTVLQTGTGWAIATADAIPDLYVLATKHQFVYSVSLYTSSSDTDFRRSTAFTTSFLPTRIAAADLTDPTGTPGGRDALVVANGLDNSVTIALPPAPGATNTPWSTTTIPVGIAPSDIALVDVNGDGLRDIVVTDQASGDVAVILNQGNGAFAPAQLFRAGLGLFGVDATSPTSAVAALVQPVSLAAGNLLGTGHSDLVVVNRGSHSFTVLANGGHGGFANPQPALTTATSLGFNVPNQPGPVVVGDFNHDGQPDVAILMEDTGQLWVYLNKGHGTYAPPIINAANTFGPPTGLTFVPGINGDADRFLIGNAFGDILTLHSDGTGHFAVDHGNLNGVPLAVGQTQDGRTFAVVADQAHDQLLMYFRQPGTDVFDPPVPIDSHNVPLLAPGAVQLANLNRNGGQTLPSLVVADQLGNDVLVYPGRVDGTFGAPTSYPVGVAPVAVTVRDLNGDGVPDLAVVNQGSNDVSILLGSHDPQTGLWTATAGPRLQSHGIGPTAVAVQDSGAARGPDLVVTNSDGTVALLPGIGSNGQGSGFFQDNTPIFLPIPDGAVQVIDNKVLNTVGQIFQIDFTTLTATLIFDPENGRVPLVLTTATFEGRDALATINSDNTLSLIDQRPDGTWAEALVFEDARLTDPSALEALGADLIVTNTGQATPLVFSLVEGLPVAGLHVGERPTATPLTPVDESGIAFVPTVLTGAAVQDVGLGLASGGTGSVNPEAILFAGLAGRGGANQTLDTPVEILPDTEVLPADLGAGPTPTPGPSPLNDFISSLQRLERQLPHEFPRDDLGEPSPPAPGAAPHQPPADVGPRGATSDGATWFQREPGVWLAAAPTTAPAPAEWKPTPFAIPLANGTTNRGGKEDCGTATLPLLPVEETAARFTPDDCRTGGGGHGTAPTGEPGLFALALLFARHWHEKGNGTAETSEFTTSRRQPIPANGQPVRQA
jgi:hypothetical protein